MAAWIGITTCSPRIFHLQTCHRPAARNKVRSLANSPRVCVANSKKGWYSICNFIKNTEIHLRTTKYLGFHQENIALYPVHLFKEKSCTSACTEQEHIKSKFFAPNCTRLDGAVEILLTEHHSVSKDFSPQSAEVVP